MEPEHKPLQFPRFYPCDPEKNTECPARYSIVYPVCGSDCTQTSNPVYKLTKNPEKREE